MPPERYARTTWPAKLSTPSMRTSSRWATSSRRSATESKAPTGTAPSAKFGPVMLWVTSQTSSPPMTAWSTSYSTPRSRGRTHTGSPVGSEHSRYQVSDVIFDPASKIRYFSLRRDADQ